MELKNFLNQFKKKKTPVISDKQIKSRSLVEQGSQLEREGRALEARSYYKMAFKVDDEKKFYRGCQNGGKFVEFWSNQ